MNEELLNIFLPCFTVRSTSASFLNASASVLSTSVVTMYVFITVTAYVFITSTLYVFITATI